MSNSVFGDLDGLLAHVDSKFSLVNVVTKRAKQLNNGKSTNPRSNSKGNNPRKTPPVATPRLRCSRSLNNSPRN